MLIDAGLTAGEIDRRLRRVPKGPSLDQIDAVLLTHEHSDHVLGAPSLMERGIHLYATEGTRVRLGLEQARAVIPGETFHLGEIRVTAIRLPHDAAEPVGYVLEAEGRRMGYVTDCGHPSRDVLEAFAHLDLFVLEANHDERLLRSGPYPPSLKRRIGSRLGHLSNAQTAALLRGLRGRRPRAVMLAHLSQVNNRPRLARAAATEAIGRGVLVEIAAQSRVSPVAVVAPSGVAFDPLPAGEQLRLFS